MSACCAPRPARDQIAKPVACEDSIREHPGTGRETKRPMAFIPAGEFLMGGADPDAFPADGEGPVRSVRTPAYHIDTMVVTNAQFSAFVDATGYVTDAERYGWSFVFYALASRVRRDDVVDGTVPGAPWWVPVRGATWRCPEGPGSDVDNRLDHPVVHVSWNDAVAYAHWACKRLPTEAEWERAARGGLTQCRYPWGDELTPEGRHRCNIWQGIFPNANTGEDGYLGTAPVDAFPPNGYGLYNTAGNVWEWCADWWSASWHVREDPRTREGPAGPPAGTAKVIRGGSYLCHASYCNRYRVAARTHNTPDSSSGHTGFRCVDKG
jgi:formylglycine-generating enzyme